MMKQLSVGSMLLLLAACTAEDRLDQTNNYWQRTNTQSAIYMTGPKAQHTLHQDISNCVAQLQELERLGSLRDAVPPNTAKNQVPDYNPSNAKIASYDTPNRDGPLFAEYYDFADFEGCMREKGWERALVMQPHQRVKSQDNWIRSLVDPNWGGADDVSSTKPADEKASDENGSFNQ